jgi:lysophospholipase L1-like esterase
MLHNISGTAIIKGMSRLSQQEKPTDAPIPQFRIVFFGDSITESGDQPGGYVSLIRDSLAQPNSEGSVTVIGAGISGNKVPDLQARVASDVITQSPDHVVIYIGINDVWHDFEFEDLTGTDPATYEQGLRDLITQIQATGAKVTLCTPSVIGEAPSRHTPVSQRLQEYAEISRTVANDQGAYLCDLQVAFNQYLQVHNPAGLTDGVLTIDGVHLNERGNRFVADVLLEHLRPLLDQ